MSELQTYTHPDTFNWMGTLLHYDRVVGIRVDNVESTELHGDTATELDIQSFEVPDFMINGLQTALHRINRSDYINCHLFSRLMRPEYIEKALAKPLGESWFPLDKYTGYNRKVATLGMGAVGVVHTSSRRSVHSLVGLGEDSGMSIQVLSHGGELAIVSTEATIAQYQEMNPAAKIELREVIA